MNTADGTRTSRRISLVAKYGPMEYSGMAASPPLLRKTACRQACYKRFSNKAIHLPTTTCHYNRKTFKPSINIM